MANRKAKKPKKGKTSCEGKSPAPAIHISIDSRGNIVVETVGTEGDQCDLLVGDLEKSLGSVTSRTNKPTYDNDG